MFPSVSPKQSFPALESEVLAYWKANNTFQKSIDSRPEDNPYRFYDGPPFITGTPHYGSLLSSVVKDVVGRYWTMRGKRVDRVWGWDCHGLPIEEKVQKKLGLKSNKEIEERGVKEFIDGCYEYTQSTSAEWDWYVDKIGRWVDMDRAYRTMDQDYMESVMWVFSELWKKGLIYEGKRVSLYSWKLSTPISNFEVAMDDTYQEVNDPAITVKFALEPNDRFPAGTQVLAWTTTPWTIPANMALAVRNDIDYVLVSLSYPKIGEAGRGVSENNTPPLTPPNLGGESEQYIVAKNRAESVFKGKGEYTIVREFKGSELVGLGYVPPFPEYYYNTFQEISLKAIKNENEKYIAHSILQEELYIDGFDSQVFDGSHPEVKDSTSFLIQKGTQNIGTAQIWKFEPKKFALLNIAIKKDFQGKGYGTKVIEIIGKKILELGGDKIYTNSTKKLFEGFYSKMDFVKGEWNDKFRDEDTISLVKKVAPDHFIKAESNKNHRIYHADFITDTDGTGIGHEAPEFGDVDFQLAKKEGIFISEAMDEAGRYTSQIFDYEGTHYLDLDNPEKGANRINIERMKANNTLFKLENITHRVPFCPRSGTPLMQKAQSSWFIDIQSQKDKLLEANQQINWFPEYLKEGRFAKGIESAPDWCISRTRFWGAPMPVWMGADGEKVVVSSREEIFEKNKPYGQLTKLIITRHAESQANVDKHYDDIGTSPLSENGKEQAELLIQDLQDKGVDIIITSPFVRAVQTAEPLAKKLGIDIITDERLRETDHGKMANAQSSPEVKMERNICFFGDDKNHKFAETGESYNDVLTRTTAVIEDICARYPGKTVLVVSHGFPTGVMSAHLRGKKIRDEVKNATTETFILDVANKNALNLHRPYIDSILLAPQNTQKAKKVLGVHGFCRTESVVDFLSGTCMNLEKDGIQMDAPVFEKGEVINYKNWETRFDELFAQEKYDTVLAHSMGSRAAIEYIIKNQISLEKLVLVSPAYTSNRPEIISFYDVMSHDVSEVKKYVKELIVLHSKDDIVHTFEQSKSFAEMVGGELIVVDGFGHFNVSENQIIESLVKLGTPLTRISEVLDVWMDSGSMPYAQMHYPFENKGEMEASFPADFIAEYVGQVRAWFYVMHVLGVLLGDLLEKGGGTSETSDGGLAISEKSEHQSSASQAQQLLSQGAPRPAFTNVITTGVINGNDGRKMSKSFGNYPDPRVTIEKYGADPIRFYMLNSPLLSGGDMDFKEEGIVETIKRVMLPIWNTYSFFTTYANIDNWEHDIIEVWFSRHGETTANASNRMSDCSDDAELNETGIAQAQNAGKELKEQGKNFDVIIHTSRKRAIATAEIIAQEIGFDGEFVLDERFAEQDAGEFSGKTLTEVAEMVGLPPDAPHSELRRKYKENKKEGLDAFEQRIIGGYEDILDQYKGKRILIVAHAGTSRPILHKYFGVTRDDAYFDRRIKNAEPFRLMTTPLVNELDRWILSRLQVLIGQVHDAMDAYDVSRACRAIVDYMDELTNWYVRLSRRRFWGSEMTADKASAYETLYTVLAETSKLLAPYMPFLSESIWKGLTDQNLLEKGGGTSRASAGGLAVSEKSEHQSSVMSSTGQLLSQGAHQNSVHLEYITRPNRHLVDSELNRDMEICEHIVSLGLALRSRKNIRVRQPLQSITITRELSEYYQAIIRDELNVKEVRYENPEKLAKKICKPDARKIGPKYGKDVQKVIMEAKNGNFTEKENGIVDVGGFVLESGEYTMEYIPLEGVGDVEGGYGMVISLDTTITESLRLEGYARDIIRAIQDMRKEADYQVTDRISLHIYGAMHTEILAGYTEMIQSETLSTFAPLMVNPDLQKDIEIEEGVVLTVQIEK